MGQCGCSGFDNTIEPDIDEKNFKRHVREKLLPTIDTEYNQIHLYVIDKDINKLKKQLKRDKESINNLDHHGYTALHLAVLLKWEKGIDLLLSYYASPIISSVGGWTPIQEAISTKQFKIAEKLINALSKNFKEYSKQNVAKIYKNLTEKTDFYIEIKLESFAKGLSGVTGHYFPKDTLKIWKKNGMVRIDMTLLDYDYDKKEWLRGDISNIFVIKKSGTFDFYHIDHKEKTVDLQPDKALLNYDNIDIDMNRRGDSLKTEIIKLFRKPVKSRRIEIRNTKLTRQKSWIGTVEEQDINDHKCSVYKASDIQFVTKYRNQHIPLNKRKHVKNDSSIVSLIISGDDDDDDDGKNDNDWKIDIDGDTKNEYEPQKITREKYQKLAWGDKDIRDEAAKNADRFDKDESFVINTVETNVSQTSYNLSLFMIDSYGITVNELLVIFDLIGVQAAHMENVKKILQLTAYDETRFPLCLEMPLLLNVVRAKITFQKLKRDSIDKKIFDIPNYKR